jgi:hypothetical protein
VQRAQAWREGEHLNLFFFLPFFFKNVDFIALGQPKPSNPSPVLAEPVARQLAEKYKTPVGTVSWIGHLSHMTDSSLTLDDFCMTFFQILLSWLIQRGWTTVPKSANPERLKQNMDVRTCPPWLGPGTNCELFLTFFIVVPTCARAARGF